MTYAVLPAYTNRLATAASAERSLDAAQRALALDPAQPEPYLAMGNVAAAISLRRETGAALLRRAIELRPSSATAHQWLGTTLVEMGRLEEGIASLERAAELDPRSLIVANNHASMLLIAGRDTQAIEACTPALEYAPDSDLCSWIIGVAHLILGDRARARLFFDRSAAAWGGGTDRQVAALFDALDGRGDRKAFARSLMAFPQRSWKEPGSGNLFGDFEAPVLLILLGEPGLALDYVDRGSRGNPIDLAWGVLLPNVDPIRCEPRFVAAVDRLKIVDYRATRMCAKGN
jgi:tetratricopeptide (TPR) repeat protein